MGRSRRRRWEGRWRRKRGRRKTRVKKKSKALMCAVHCVRKGGDGDKRVSE